MRNWPALLVAPVLALVDQSAAYALLPWACATQNAPWLNGVHLVFLLGALATLVPAARGVRASHGLRKADSGEAGDRPRLLPIAALLVGLLSSLVIVAMWIPHAVLSPCYG